MKHLPALICALLLAGALSACVPAQQHEELKAQHQQLEQTLRTQKRLLYNAKKDYHTVVDRLEGENHELQQQLSHARTQLRDEQEQLEEFRQKYKIASVELSKAAENSLALIKQKNELKGTIIELQGTIATLQDTVKDLRDRLDQVGPAQPPSQVGPKEKPADAPPRFSH